MLSRGTDERCLDALCAGMVQFPPGRSRMKQHNPAKPKVTIIPAKGVSQTLNYLLEDRDQLDWLVAVGRNKNGDILFYDTGGDILEDLGTLEYLKQRIVRAHFGEDYE
jgi:hypothetical protein